MLPLLSFVVEAAVDAAARAARAQGFDPSVVWVDGTAIIEAVPRGAPSWTSVWTIVVRADGDVALTDWREGHEGSARAAYVRARLAALRCRRTA